MAGDTSTEIESAAVGALPLADRRIDPLECSVAGFVGLAPGGPVDRAVRVDSFEAFAARFGDPERPQAGPFLAGAKLAHAVRGFFRNGGRACWVVRVPGAAGACEAAGHVAALRALAVLDEPTIIAAPDAYGSASGTQGAAAIQRELVAGCERIVGRIALVDPPPDLDAAGALAWRARSHLDSAVAAAYHPWLEVGDPASGTTTAVPPSGHVAGLWARVDAGSGPYRAPTAEALLAADGPASGVSAAEQHQLNRAGLNCLRAWPGPELRAWGACTLARDPALRYLHHQRIVGHLVGSIAQGTRWAAEADGERLHEQLRLTVTAFLTQAWRAGALQGDTPAQAFSVRCEPRREDGSSRGEIVVEVGLAVRRRGEFRVLRIAHHDIDG
ncbi:MAG TPA: phage tail sheath subtilisin-like domain-containing protein [Solirubrobacteraceae bacterium]|nr:phage tail sheath subtilisin-like domain-containing protein [Solirubrobacteraceae bacterium]